MIIVIIRIKVSTLANKQTIEDVLNKWEFHTLQGDGCYHRGEFKAASHSFGLTVDLLEPWLEKEHKQLWKVVRLFVISCHNSAHACSKYGRHKEAEYYYSYAHFRLLSLISSCRYSRKAMEKTLSELRATFLQLTKYLLDKGKITLAASIKEESVRVVQLSYMDHVGDVFTA
jgi:hypothetical protein